MTPQTAQDDPTLRRALIRAVERLKEFTASELASDAGVSLEHALAFVQEGNLLEPVQPSESLDDLSRARWKLKVNAQSGWRLAANEPTHSNDVHGSGQDRLLLLKQSIASLSGLTAGSEEHERELSISSLELRAAQTSLWDRQVVQRNAFKRESEAIEDLRRELHAHAPSRAQLAPRTSATDSPSALWECLLDWTCPVPKKIATTRAFRPRGRSLAERLIDASLQGLASDSADDTDSVVELAARVLHVWNTGEPEARGEARAALTVRMQSALELPQAQALLPGVAAIALVLQIAELSSSIFRAMLVDPSLGGLGPPCRRMLMATFCRIARESLGGPRANDAASACLYLVNRCSPGDSRTVLVAGALLADEANPLELIANLESDQNDRALFANPNVRGKGKPLFRTLSNAIFSRQESHELGAWESVFLSDSGRDLLSALVEPGNFAARVIPAEGLYELRPSERVAMCSPQGRALRLHVTNESAEEQYLQALVKRTAKLPSNGPTQFTSNAGAKWKQ